MTDEHDGPLRSDGVEHAAQIGAQSLDRDAGDPPLGSAMTSLVPQHHARDAPQRLALARPGVKGKAIAMAEDHSRRTRGDVGGLLDHTEGDAVIGDHLARDPRGRLDAHELALLQATRSQALRQGARRDAGREDAECGKALGAPAQIGHAHPST